MSRSGEWSIGMAGSTGRKDRPALEAALTAGESALDIVMSGDLFASIPLIGLAFKAAKALDSVRDRLFAAKILAFVESAGNENHGTAHADMAARLDDVSEQQRVGETLVLTLEQVTDTEKARLLGRLYRCCLDGRITGPELRRLARAVHQAFYDDLLAFGTGNGTSQPFMQELV